MKPLDPLRPTPDEDLVYADRFRAAETAAREEKLAFYRDPARLRAAYFSDPAHAGKPVAILDWVVENSPERSPGMSIKSRSGLARLADGLESPRTRVGMSRLLVLAAGPACAS